MNCSRSPSRFAAALLPYGLTLLFLSKLSACMGPRPTPSPFSVNDTALPAAISQTSSDSSPPSKKPASPTLAVFGELIDQPRTILDWNSSQRLQWYSSFFDNVLELANRDHDHVFPILIAGLIAPEPAIYQPAAYLLRHVAGTGLRQPTYGTQNQRTQAHAIWSKWWSKTREDRSFRPVTIAENTSTIVVDEIPGRLVGNDDYPPGRLLHFRPNGTTLFEIYSLKMPYDVALTPAGNYLVNIIRACAVFKVSPEGTVLSKIKVGGYPCSVQRLESGNIVVAGWDDDVPGFVREFDPNGEIVWALENLRWPWKASRLGNGNTLVADAGRNRVFEVNNAGQEIWAIENLGPPKPELFDALGPVYAQRLQDGNTLVSIRGLSKVVELDPEGVVVWELVSGSQSRKAISAVLEPTSSIGGSYSV